jgi:UDP-N-acetylmuramoyl-tripeptide--D-alanyl-D-alanine ligase
MDARPLKSIAESCAGELSGGSPEAVITRVCTDSRAAAAGDLFVALAGERFEGHDYVGAAAERGVAAAMVQRGKVLAVPTGCGLVLVDDTRQALGRLAARYRREFDLPIIAVGGSNGKTTTKELVAGVLGRRLRLLASEASFNNDVGVPLTLLRLGQRHQAAVLEVGTNHPGELAPLVRMAQPRIGVITSLGREHLEFFGDLAGVTEEEGWLAELLPADGTLLVNGDCPGMEQIVGRTWARVVRVGFGPANHWRARLLQVDQTGTAFAVEGPEPALAGTYRIRLAGRHQVINALFAIVLGGRFGMNREAIECGLADCVAPKMRLQIWEVDGVRVLDDAYNANADSMAAALQTLHDLPCAGRRVAVLGDMAELGAHGPEAHAEAGRRAAELGVDHLFAVGRLAAVTGAAARAAGLVHVATFEDAPAAGAALRRLLARGDVVLLKASRVARLEQIGEALRHD